MGASERDRWLRAAWQTLVAGQIDAERLVFVDEMGSNTSLFSLLYVSWAPRGERALCSVAPNRGENTTTLLASMTTEGMGPSLAVVGATTTRVVFETH